MDCITESPHLPITNLDYHHRTSWQRVIDSTQHSEGREVILYHTSGIHEVFIVSGEGQRGWTRKSSDHVRQQGLASVVFGEGARCFHALSIPLHRKQRHIEHNLIYCLPHYPIPVNSCSRINFPRVTLPHPEAPSSSQPITQRGFLDLISRASHTVCLKIAGNYGQERRQKI